MADLPCPHCDSDTITWLEKYKAAKWLIIYCPKCQGRLCSNPYVLVFYTLLYFWSVVFFAYVALLERSWIYAALAVISMIILDFFSLYLPMSALRAKNKSK
jgi:hypothetical protein